MKKNFIKNHIGQFITDPNLCLIIELIFGFPLRSLPSGAEKIFYKW